MTIQRQYVLPNCSLVLEGLSTDTSNVLSILANAEFKIVGIEHPLAGGSDFFKALVNAVSAYCQRLLSGLDHPDHMIAPSSLVALEPGEGQYHRLSVKPELLNESSEMALAQPINLSTVQLFDMAEAIDQFCADTQALPDFSIQLAPLPRKYVRAEEPLAQRAIPPLLGFGTLAIAALGLFFLPVPELVEPENLEQQNTTALEESTGNESVSDSDTQPTAEPSTSVDVANDETPETAQNSGPITDTAQLSALQQQLQQQISSALPDDISFDQPLRYQISVAENGDILGYNPLDEASLENLDSTPLPVLTYIPIDSTTTVEPVAQFDVTLRPDGTVEVASEQGTIPSEAVTPEAVTPEVVTPNPPEKEGEPEGSSRNTTEQSATEQTNDKTTDSASKATASSPSNGKLSAFVDTPIRDVDRITELNQELRRSIINNRGPNWSGPELRYRIRLDEDGNVTGYEADNSAGEQYAADFKLPDLVKRTTIEQPQLDFLVVIDANNVVQVNPWDGWP